MKLFIKNKNSIELLIKPLRKNCPNAQRELYNLLSNKMFAVCKSYVTDVHYAEDCLVNGFCKVYNNVRKFENKGNFEGWIRRIMINECLSFLRKNKTFIFIDDTKLSNYNSIDEDLDNLELNFNVDEILLELPENYRLIFNLYVLEDFTHQQIADTLKISISSSKTQLFRAKCKLKEIILKQNLLKHEI